MTLGELRARAYERLGEHLEHTTPERLRAFLDEIEAEVRPHDPRAVLELGGPTPSFEEAEREFFARVLRSAEEPSFVALWLMAAELWAASLEERGAE
jgi:hypothetical protein